jgi:hypothetical protein
VTPAATDTVTRGDIEAKLREIQGEVEETGRSVKPYVLAAAAVGAVAVVGLAYVLGRRRGRRTTTVVEVRRL